MPGSAGRSDPDVVPVTHRKILPSSPPRSALSLLAGFVLGVVLLVLVSVPLIPVRIVRTASLGTLSELKRATKVAKVAQLCNSNNPSSN